jgi:hypothetical protein
LCCISGEGIYLELSTLCPSFLDTVMQIQWPSHLHCDTHLHCIITQWGNGDTEAQRSEVPCLPVLVIGKTKITNLDSLTLKSIHLTMHVQPSGRKQISPWAGFLPPFSLLSGKVTQHSFKMAC